METLFRKGPVRSPSWFPGLTRVGLLAIGSSAGPARGATTTFDTTNTPYAGGHSGTFLAVNFTGLGVGQSATLNVVTGWITIVPERFAARRSGMRRLHSVETSHASLTWLTDEPRTREHGECKP